VKDVPERVSEVQHISQTMQTVLQQLKEIQEKMDIKSNDATA
jgi:hypothetical protein